MQISKNDIERFGIDTSNLPEGAKIIHRKDSVTGEDVWEVWTLQMPLFILISGYVTRYSKPIYDGKSLWQFIKKRTLAYLLPWVVWTILVRGLVFGEANFLNLKYMLWHMDSGYWFLATIWTISMIYGLSDYLSNKWGKEKKVIVTSHILICVLEWLCLAAIGYMLGIEFFAIKLTLYYIPIYLIGYLYGQIQDKFQSGVYAKSFVNVVVMISLCLWLAAINRFDFFSGTDGIGMIAGRFMTSMFGCAAVIGLFVASGGGIQTTQLDGRAFFRGIPHALSVLEPNSCNESANSCVQGRIGDTSSQLYADLDVNAGNNKVSAVQSCNESFHVCKTKLATSLNWCGIHSLEIYLIHGFSLCLLQAPMKHVLHSACGWVLVVVNFLVAVVLSVVYIDIIERNRYLNKILFWK